MVAELLALWFAGWFALATDIPDGSGHAFIPPLFVFFLPFMLNVHQTTPSAISGHHHDCCLGVAQS